MIKLVNGMPEKLIEMDEKVTLIEQKAFAVTAEVLKQQPRYISAQLHRGIAGSCVFLNYEIWESAKHFKQAVNSSEFQSSIVGCLQVQ